GPPGDLPGNLLPAAPSLVSLLIVVVIGVIGIIGGDRWEIEAARLIEHPLRAILEIVAGHEWPGPEIAGEAQVIGTTVATEVERRRAVVAGRALLLPLGEKPAAVRVDAAVELPASPNKPMNSQAQGTGSSIRKRCPQDKGRHRFVHKVCVGCVF